MTTYAAPGSPLRGGFGMSNLGERGVPATPSARRHDVFWGIDQDIRRARVVKPTNAKQACLPQSFVRARYLT
ncbi:hypothetical protein GCM10025762_35410 [Haloechinothrix salitolerans]